MTSARSGSILVSAVVPLLIAVVAAFLGMFLPIAVYELTHTGTFHPHNVVWESVFGIGFYIAGFFGSCMADRWVAVVGFLAWPLTAMVIVFFVSRAIFRRSVRYRVICSILFVVSLLVCVGDDAENYLSLHHVPLYWNLYATCY